MVRLIAVAVALTLATSVQAMSPAPLHQPDGMITQIRETWCAGRVRINGVCVAITTSARPQVCAMEWRLATNPRHHPTGWGRKERVCSNTLNLPSRGCRRR